MPPSTVPPSTCKDNGLALWLVVLSVEPGDARGGCCVDLCGHGFTGS